MICAPDTLMFTNPRGTMMRNRRHGVVCALLMVLSGCATIPQPPAEPIDDNLIVPKSRIGKLALGISEATLLQWMGTPDKSLGDLYHYRSGDLDLAFEGGKLASVKTRSARFATAEGIAVGAPEIKLRATWGAPVTTYEYAYFETEQCGAPVCDATEVAAIEYCFSNGLVVQIDPQPDRRVVRAIKVDYRGC